ncbi:MAG: type II toxin-antitoxin system mRNA interferase toxin, RelE/StbE family [Bacteroidetes bacterium]|nr:type II toxin-antitoxin system mRNA interferase toxin, RelE/StbE family [Bacteroidota bacterium]
MVRELVLTDRFKKSFSKFVKKHPNLKGNIYNTLELMKEDIYSQSLSTHKLSGKLSVMRACSCGYDCRIIFSIEKPPDSTNEVIMLIDIGTHEDVY